MNILYGVPSEGMGHATRSKVVIGHLLSAGHDVRIATSDRAFELLEKTFPGRGFRIEGLHLRYDQGTVSKWGTFKELVSSGPKSLLTNTEAFLELRKAAPVDLVISDFESFSYYFAKHRGLPLLSIDNMQVINRCELGFEIPEEERENYLLAKGIIKAKVPFCDRYLVTSFFSAPPRKERTTVVPPILRPEILAAKLAAHARSPTDAPVLVYQTASAQEDLVRGLQAIRGEKFLVYGLHRDEKHENVTLKKFSEAGFIADLCASKAVITNGGFSLISESVFLHKPVCSFPLSGQFEQYVNGAEVETMGYGRRFSAFGPDAVRAFLHQLPEFTENIRAYQQDDNSAMLREVDSFVDAVASGQLQGGADES